MAQYQYAMTNYRGTRLLQSRKRIVNFQRENNYDQNRLIV